MKTTVDIPDALFREAKATAGRNGTKLKDLIAEGLRRVLGEATPKRRRVSFPLIPARPDDARLTADQVAEVLAKEDLQQDLNHARPRRR